MEYLDHTPNPFPYPSSLPPQNVLRPARTPASLRKLWRHPAHRFILEAKPGLGESIGRVNIWVNGDVHAMAMVFRGLWVFESKNECTNGYEYHFEISWKRWLGTIYPGRPRKSLTPDSVISVAGWDDVIWVEIPDYEVAGLSHWPIPYPVHFSQDAPLNFPIWFLDPGMTERVLVIQNLRANPVAIDITLANAPAFSLIGVPPTASQGEISSNSLTLNCGESLRFRILWVGGESIDQGTLEMKAADGAFVMNRSENLLGQSVPR